MSSPHGTNLTSIKEKNRELALQLIATQQQVSRVELARKMHLTKTTLGNIVSELIEKGLVTETHQQEKTGELSIGRRPITLDLAPNSPIIAGMLIERNLLTVVLADLKGTILAQTTYEYDYLNEEILPDKLTKMFHQLADNQSRQIIAVGISSIGPVDTAKQMILSPANFWGIHDYPIGPIIQGRIGLPTFLIHDSSASALAEKLYRHNSLKSDNLLYLHIMNGIGTGYILHGQLYEGDMGRSGQLGHMSINFNGPRCNCGNAGCLELYANTNKMNEKIRSMRQLYHFPSPFPLSVKPNYTWEEIIEAANASDIYALSAVDEFCEHLTCALQNTISLLDIHHIIVGYNGPAHVTILEDVLSRKLNAKPHDSNTPDIIVEKSSFGGQAPLIGAIAVVANNIFNGTLNIF